MTGKLSKNFHGVGIGPLSNILAVKWKGCRKVAKLFPMAHSSLSKPQNNETSNLLLQMFLEYSFVNYPTYNSKGSFVFDEVNSWIYQGKANISMCTYVLGAMLWLNRGHLITTWTKRGGRGSIESPRLVMWTKKCSFIKCPQLSGREG